jgi:hypothetical protein
MWIFEGNLFTKISWSYFRVLCTTRVLSFQHKFSFLHFMGLNQTFDIPLFFNNLFHQPFFFYQWVSSEFVLCKADS